MILPFRALAVAAWSGIFGALAWSLITASGVTRFGALILVAAIALAMVSVLGLLVAALKGARIQRRREVFDATQKDLLQLVTVGRLRFLTLHVGFAAGFLGLAGIALLALKGLPLGFAFAAACLLVASVFIFAALPRAGNTAVVCSFVTLPVPQMAWWPFEITHLYQRTRVNLAIAVAHATPEFQAARMALAKIRHGDTTFPDMDDLPGHALAPELGWRISGLARCLFPAGVAALVAMTLAFLLPPKSDVSQFLGLATDTTSPANEERVTEPEPLQPPSKDPVTDDPATPRTPPDSKSEEEADIQPNIAADQEDSPQSQGQTSPKSSGNDSTDAGQNGQDAGSSDAGNSQGTQNGQQNLPGSEGPASQGQDAGTAGDGAPGEGSDSADGQPGGTDGASQDGAMGAEGEAVGDAGATSQQRGDQGAQAQGQEGKAQGSEGETGAKGSAQGAQSGEGQNPGGASNQQGSDQIAGDEGVEQPGEGQSAGEGQGEGSAAADGGGRGSDQGAEPVAGQGSGPEQGDSSAQGESQGQGAGQGQGEGQEQNEGQGQGVGQAGGEAQAGGAGQGAGQGTGEAQADDEGRPAGSGDQAGGVANAGSDAGGGAGGEEADTGGQTQTGEAQPMGESVVGKVPGGEGGSGQAPGAGADGQSSPDGPASELQMIEAMPEGAGEQGEGLVSVVANQSPMAAEGAPPPGITAAAPTLPGTTPDAATGDPVPQRSPFWIEQLLQSWLSR